MDLLTLWIASLCGWALLNHWLLPLKKTAWQALDLRQKMAKAGTFAVLEKLRDLTGVSAVCLAAVLLLVQLAGMAADGSSAMPKAVLDSAAGMHDWARRWSDSYGSTTGVLALIGAAVALAMVARHARQRVATAWIGKANEVRARLQAQPDEIGQALHDSELQPLAERIAQLLQQLNALEQASPEPNHEAQAAALHEALSDALSALAIEKARRELDFKSAIAQPGADEDRLPATPWQRLGRVLASERFCSDIGLLKKPLSYVLTGLLLVSLVGWTAAPMADSLQLAVNNLRVNAQRSEAQRSVDQALSVARQDKTEPPDTAAATAPAAVQAATRLMARAAAHELTRSPLISRLARTERTLQAEAEYVRAAIADQHVMVDEHPGPVSNLRREVAQSVAQDLPEPNTQHLLHQRLEQQMQPLVEQLQRDNPGLLRRMSSHLEARYATPVTPLDAQGKLIDRLFDSALGGIDAHPDTELGKQGQKLGQEFGKKAVRTMIDNFAHQYVANTVFDAARGDVVRSLHTTPAFETSSQARQFAQDLIDAEGSHWTGSAAAREEERMARAVAQAVANRPGTEAGARAAVLDRLSGYDHLFPANEPSGGGSGGGGGNARPSPHAGPGGNAGGRSFAQSRATNFHLASRSFRVRGVLVGREHGSQVLAVRDIRWAVGAPREGESTAVAIALQVGDSWREIGSFEAGVVNQALRYAADQRVIATTITPGDGQLIGRVTYLHPVLADTPLGCRVVEADRFIDTFSFTKPRTATAAATPTAMAQLAQDRIQMGRWMATVKLADAVVAATSGSACPREQLNKLVQQRGLGNVVFTPATTAALERFMGANDKADASRFLRKAHQCAIGNPGQLTQCLCTLAKDGNPPGPYWLPEDHTSQFRERQRELTPDLRWLQRSPDRLGHIDLWVHTTLALHHKAADGSEETDEASATAIDFAGDQLASLRTLVHAQLPHYLDTQLRTSYDAFMAPLEDFVLLQRLARAALGGGLGREFPIGKLVRLERDTRKFVPQQPTIRWEPAEDDPGGLQKTLAEADPKALQAYQRWRRDLLERTLKRAPACDRASN